MISPLTFRRGGSVCCVAVCALLAMIYPATGVPIDRVADHANTLDPSSPPLTKGGQGGFFISDLRSSDQSKSPSVPLFQRGMQTQPQCVELMSDAGVQRSVPIRLGSTLRLSFRHSIYGSQVEEAFAVGRDGFHLTQLRYSEARLVDFYGYENAKHEDGMWIVRPRPAVIPSLNLQTGSAASLLFDHQTSPIQLAVPTDSALRLTVAACKDASDG